MIYNILVIDEKEDASSKFLKMMEDIEIFFASSKGMVTQFFITYEIHAILINPNTIDLKTLASLFDELLFKYTDIPIFVIGEYSEEYLQSSPIPIYDLIDMESNKNISLNKIKFCQNLYQKQLLHESNIQKILYIDSLTKLPNRAKLIKDIQDDIGINSLAVIDINSFKDINEFFGLKIGDNILKSVVDVIDNLIRFIKDKVLLYKFSSDVYCLANIGLDKKDFEDIILYALGAIESKVFEEDGHEINIRAKAGVTFSSKKNKLITADIALKEAKKKK